MEQMCLKSHELACGDILNKNFHKVKLKSFHLTFCKDINILTTFTGNQYYKRESIILLKSRPNYPAWHMIREISRACFHAWMTF